MPRKRNKVWSISRENLEKIVQNNDSLAGILRDIGLPLSSGHYMYLKKKLKDDKMNLNHIKLGSGCNKGRSFPNSKKKPLNEILIKDSTYHRGHLKKRLIKEGILENKCSICGIEKNWNGKDLIMIIDHINGEGLDNRIENLRLVCPNCDSQLPTYCGRHRRKKYYCECGKKIKKNVKKCIICNNKELSLNNRKVKNRPSKEEIQEMQKTMSMVAIGKKYGVSDNAVRKWMK